MSSLRFESRTKEAVSLATTLAGGVDQMSLTWLTPGVIETATAFPEVQEAAQVELDASPEEEEANAPLADYLAEDDIELHPELDEQSSACDVIPAVKVIWEAPPVSRSYFS